MIIIRYNLRNLTETAGERLHSSPRYAHQTPVCVCVRGYSTFVHHLCAKDATMRTLYHTGGQPAVNP